jgi:deazaflavin-dependent oxidoreductase (nitroreductase family)
MTTSTRASFDADRPRYSRPVRALARAFGPLARPVAGTRVFPFWAILRHTGRRSGAQYATPVVARPVPDGYLIPLPFGDATQWARNVFAAGGATLRIGGRERAVADPVVVSLADAGRELSPVIRFSARRVGIRQFVRVRTVDGRG